MNRRHAASVVGPSYLRRSVSVVLALLASTSTANRPGSLNRQHETLQARGEHIGVHVGGHFSKEKKNHSFTEIQEKEQVKTKAPDLLGINAAAGLGKNAVGAIEKKTLSGAPDPAKSLHKWNLLTPTEQDYPAVAPPKCGEEYEGGPQQDTCPKDCRFAAEMDTEADPKKECHFKCVTATQCGAANTQKTYTIADEGEDRCRRCNVEGCLTCQAGKPGEDVEKCTKCMPGYYMAEIEDGLAGECRCWSIWVFLTVAIFGAIGALFGIIWYIDLACRPVVNEEGLEKAMEARSLSKLRQPMNTEAGEGGVGPGLLYPFYTNLCTANVAGPGNMLFFRFQAVILIWSIVLVSVWCIMLLAIDSNLFALGLMPAKTPQQMCYVIKMGRGMQLHYLWVKVDWLIFAYVFSFLGAIYYAASSHRLFQTLDNDHTTMADYVAICRSLPVMKGDQNVEDRIKECVEKETGEKVVGVSVCWNFHGKVREVKEALEEDVGSLEHAKATNGGRFGRGEQAASPDDERGIEDESGGCCLARVMDKINNSTLAKWHCHFHDNDHKVEEAKKAETVEMLKNLENTEMAFVVFETEDGRDKALELTKGRAIPLGDAGFFLEPENHEPESCCWEDFAIPEAQIAARLMKGVMMMTVSVTLWTVLLYVPYAHYMGSFSFKNGDEPGEMAESVFIVLIVGAQLGLFIVANKVSHDAGFCFEDDKQRTYISLYNAALVVNLVLDMSLTSWLAYNQMCGRGVRTADGVLLSDLTDLQKIIESYPMQKMLGANLFKYCWPCTFLIPFAAEPIAAQIGPYIIGRNLVRSNPKMQGENAEKALELSEAEQGRYADVMFNAILFTCIPFVAPAYMARVGVAMIASHVFIYCYDHWRVLRCCARFHFASDVVNTFAQKIFAIPCALLACGVVFKGNQMLGFQAGDNELGAGPLKNYVLWCTMVGVFFGHFFLHLLVLDYVVPMFGRGENKNAAEAYDQCASSLPCTWFSSNPVHCLRSKYFHKHDPPQSFYVVGKEYLQKKNPAIGCYFEQEIQVSVQDTLGMKGL